MPVAPITEIVAEMKAGRMVILVDEEDRENEGDLVLAADCVSADAVNFMARFGRGLVCMSITEARARQLALAPMTPVNRSVHGTNFTVSIEAAHGVSSGISAADRAHTIRVAAAANATPDDIVRPGHVFPLRARPGGVLERRGHTETAVDLAVLAGLPPVAVTCEVLADDGSPARLADLRDFASSHRIAMVSVEQVVQYRLANASATQRSTVATLLL